MEKIESLEVSDAVLEKAGPFVSVPQRELNKNSNCKPEGGRRPVPPRRIFEAIAWIPTESSFPNNENGMFVAHNLYPV